MCRWAPRRRPRRRGTSRSGSPGGATWWSLQTKTCAPPQCHTSYPAAAVHRRVLFLGGFLLQTVRAQQSSSPAMCGWPIMAFIACINSNAVLSYSQDDEDYLPGGHSRPASQRQQQRPQCGHGQHQGEAGRPRSLPGAPCFLSPASPAVGALLRGRLSTPMISNHCRSNMRSG
jgi:hypothetical protein